MSSKFFVIIETENAFVQEFEKALRREAIDNYRVVQVTPEFTGGSKPMIEKCLAKILGEIKTNEIVAFYIDLSIGFKQPDKNGIDIGAAIREKFPDKPMFCITHKNKYDNNFDNMSDASLEDFDGVFEKNYLIGQDFSEQRLETMLIKAAQKRSRQNEGPGKPVSKKKKVAEPMHCDVALVTALFDNEFEQVLNYIEVDSELSKSTDTQSTKVGKLKNSKLSVVAAYQNKMGQVDAAILSATILSRYRPKLLVMTGVCAGRLTKGVEIGHIIVPSEIYDYQTGKYDNGVLKPYAYRVKIEEDLISMAREWRVDLLRQMEDSAGQEKARIKDMKVHFDVMACGSLVLKTDGSLDNIAEQMDEKTVAVEMESYGIARSCDIKPHKNHTRAMIIKASMDGATGAKNDRDKEWAAYMSCSFAYHFVKRLETQGYFK
jgi:nucleoside phosphorylase